MFKGPSKGVIFSEPKERPIFFVIKHRFIVFKMTAQITRSTLKKQKLKKVEWGQEMKEKL